VVFDYLLKLYLIIIIIFEGVVVTDASSYYFRLNDGHLDSVSVDEAVELILSALSALFGF